MGQKTRFDHYNVELVQALYRHSKCFSSTQETLAEWSARQEPINQSVAAIWELVVTSTLRTFRDEMVRSQLIIVTNSTQMQERLLAEPDTCP